MIINLMVLAIFVLIVFFIWSLVTSLCLKRFQENCIKENEKCEKIIDKISVPL